MPLVQVLRGSGGVEVQSHHQGHSSFPPLRSNVYATMLTAPMSVHAVTRTNTLPVAASLWLVRAFDWARCWLARAIPMSLRRLISSTNLLVTDHKTNAKLLVNDGVNKHKPVSNRSENKRKDVSKRWSKQTQNY